MKFLLAFLLIPLSSQASLKFSLERSTPMGTDKLAVYEEAGELIVKKTSNWFDDTLDTRLGEFRANDAEPLLAVASDVAMIELQIKAADERLSRLGRSFNELNPTVEPHAPFFRVNGYRIQRSSSLYPRLEEIAQRLQKTSLKLLKGVELDKDRKHYVFYADGKEVKREAFNARFFCESSRFPTRCLAREWGALYLE